MLLAVEEKNAVVVGFARSGVGAAHLLVHLGARVTINDAKPADCFGERLCQLDPSIRTVFGSHPAELFSSADLIVISPGVPVELPVLKDAAARGIPLIGELELAYAAVRQFLPAGRKAPQFLAITGTNGKSTTTTLLHEMMLAGGFNAILCGNIGTAISETVLESGVLDACSEKPPVDFFVVELSSFQLETIVSFRPSGATILNLTPDHLDRYHTMDGYIAAKCRIFENQGKNDVLVLNADDPYTPMFDLQWQKDSEVPNVLYFSRKQTVRGASMENGRVVLHFDGMREILDPADFTIKGVHNIENAMAAALIALSAGCRADAVRSALRTFSGLEHRLEPVRSLDGVQYINDSKGTNVGAVLKSLEGYATPVILIAGGRDKDSDFRLLRDAVRSHVKALVLIGEAAGKIADAVGDLSVVYREADLRSAVARCRALAATGDTVLLSPACASFDMFRDFEDRGRQFKELVREL